MCLTSLQQRGSCETREPTYALCYRYFNNTFRYRKFVYSCRFALDKLDLSESYATKRLSARKSGTVKR